MTDPTVNTLIGQLAAIILAIATLIGVATNCFVSWRAKQVTVKNGEKTDVLVTKADDIHTLVNGGLAKMKSDLAIANAALVDSNKLLAMANQRIIDLQQQVIALTTKQALS